MIRSEHQSQFLVRTGFLVAILGLLALPAAAQTCTGTTTVTCTGSTGGTFTGNENAWTSIPGSPYSYTVPGTVIGTVTAVTVQLAGVSANGATTGFCLADAAFMLEAPSGASFYFMNQAGLNTCTTTPSNITNLTINIADTFATAMPSAGTVWPTSGSISVKPGTGYNAAGLLSMTGYPGGASGSEPAPAGTATFTSVFTGVTAAGTWKLYAADNPEAQGGDSVAFGSWTLTLTVAASSVSTNTAVSSNGSSPIVTGTSVTYTATVTSTSGTPGGTVTFTDMLPGGTATNLACSGGNPATLSGGVATCAISIAAEGNHVITANYNGASGFGTSSGFIDETYRDATTNPSGTQFCNTGSMSFPGAQANQAIYPSYINVTGVSQTVATLSVQLKGLNSNSNINGLGSVQMMLVSPSNQAYEFLSDAASGVAQASANVTFADLNPSAPEDGTLTSGATYEGSSFTSGDVYPSPAPSGELIAQPGGGSASATFEQAFSGATSNGNWLLYVHDNGGSGSSAAMTGGWCINLTLNTGTNTTTTVASSMNPSATGTSVTITATVKSGSTPVTSGSVTFTENGSPVAGASVSNPVSLNGSGQASISTSALPEGDNVITATYDGVSAFNPSFGTIDQRTDNVTTVTGTAPYAYCNTGAIAIPASNNSPNDLGPGSPNPSNIFVSSLPGTINKVTLTLKNYHATVPNIVDSLLVGPGATNGQTFDFFSGVGGNTSSFGPGTLTLSDAGGTLVPTTAFSAGTFKPTSYGSGDTYTQSPSGFYTLPAGPYNYAATTGTSTFASLYASKVANGTWSLYFNQTNLEPGGGVNNGWCLNFTENPVTGTGTTGATNPMTQGGTGNVTLSLKNDGDSGGNGSTGDPTLTNPMTVAGTLPTGLTFGTVPTGTPWNCVASTTTTVSCTSENMVASGASYPLLTLPVLVANNAAASVTISGFTFGGAGMTVGTFPSDSPTINPAPVLSITKSHTGTFTQGQTATWTIQVSNTAATIAGATNGSTVTVSDTLPSGYTLSSGTGTGWSCSGNNTVTCTTSAVVAGGNTSFNLITLIVNVPASSATSVSNTALAYGGGDLVHTNSGNAASGSDNNVPVVQVPASITTNSGTTPQTAAINQGFANPLAATVKDAGGVGVPSVSVTFTGPATGASGTFSNSSNTITVATNGSGVATGGTFTANATAGGPYSVTAVAGSLSTSFSLTNLPGTATHLSVTAPGTATAGTSFNGTVTAKDAGNNTATGYSGTVSFTSSDPQGVMPANTTLINGTGTFSATLKTAGNQSITATDTVTSTITGTSGTIVVSAGLPNSITTNSGSTPQSATVSTSFTNPLAVTVKDASSNAVSGVSVVFTAPSTGASGAFSNTTNTITVPTNTAGVASAGTFTANATAGGPYLVTAVAGSLSTSFSLTNNAVVSAGPTVVSYNVTWGTVGTYNVIGTTRNRLPWQITGVKVVFSEAIATGNVNSLSGTGLTTTGFSGLGTNTLTWTINPLAIGNFPTTLAGSGANALKDSGGNALAGGSGFSQNLKILYGDFNDDGVVNSTDLLEVQAAFSASYNILADLNGDGVVNVLDYTIVRTRLGTSLP